MFSCLLRRSYTWNERRVKALFVGTKFIFLIDIVHRIYLSLRFLIDSFLLCFTRTVPYYGRKSTRTVPLELLKKIVRYGRTTNIPVLARNIYGRTRNTVRCAALY